MTSVQPGGGGCIQRCMGIDALNGSPSFLRSGPEIRTRYYQNFIQFMKKAEGGPCPQLRQTDVKGNRPWRPHQQKDPTSTSGCGEKPDGIIVSGAKAHNSCSVYVDEIVAIPTAPDPEEKDWPWPFRSRGLGRSDDH